MVRITVVALMALVAAPAAGQDVEPQIGIQARSITADGTANVSAGGSDPFVPGQTLSQYLYAGSLAGGATLCSLGAADGGSSTTVDGLRRKYAHVWKITTSAVKFESGNQTFDLDWARYSSEGGGAPVVSGHQRLTLAEGQRYVLDLLHAPPDSRGCRALSVKVEIEASVNENARLAETLLQYDLWLVRQDSNGVKSTSHVITTGLQGADLPFGFVPARFALPKLVPDQFDFDVVSRVGGRLRGRMREDGRIALDMHTRRTDDVARRGVAAAARAGIGGEGRKLIDVAPGEAVEIKLPARNGTSSTLATPAAVEAAKGEMSGVRGPGSQPGPSEPLSIVDGRLVVRYAPFFEGQPVSLIVQVKRVE